VVFKWDPRKAAANIRKHRIDFHEAVTVLNDALSTTFPDTDEPSVELRFVTVGFSTRGRILVVVQPRKTARSGSSAPGKLRLMNEGSMKKDNWKSASDLRPEYDFASMKGGVRRKYVTQDRAGTNLVLLDPELAEALPTDAAVNDALRAVLKIAEVVRLPNKTVQPRRTRRAAAERRVP